MEKILQELLLNDPMRFVIVIMGLISIGLIGKDRTNRKYAAGLTSRLEMITNLRDESHELLLKEREAKQQVKSLASELIASLRLEVKTKDNSLLQLSTKYSDRERLFTNSMNNKKTELSELKSTVRLEKQKVVMLERQQQLLEQRISQLEQTEGLKDDLIKSLNRQLELAQKQEQEHLEEITRLQNRIKELEKTDEE